MPKYEDRLFGPNWLDVGRVKRHVIETKTPLSALRATFTVFQETEEYAFILKAMKDWNDWIDREWANMKPGFEGYNIRMGQLQAMRKYGRWFHDLIIDLKGLENAPEDGEERTPDDIENYV